MSQAFARLHPALQHHIVNSLGWRSLRPLQELAIEPLLAGQHALLLAPTAGGKTEAAFFPVLSKMLQQEWHGLSVLYLCPIKALLNNLHLRLQGYGAWVGRTVALWHGDVSDRDKDAIRREPPNVLLTTPESLEVLLTSRRSNAATMFGGVQVVVVDELHAFAGDDRGWHLLSVLARIAKLAGRPIQRIGLSATIGNPDGLLTWFAEHAGGTRTVVSPPPVVGPQPEVRLDHVASLENAATVISRLHRGEKRLVFVDSRARVEQLASALRGNGVQTYVSHSSVSLDERKQAEAAFSQGSNCVIVATSTLELGIDVGDLDRVIQLDAPGSVASFLQRLGRTGRRPGTSRNCLFLTTSDDGFLRAAGLLDLWSRGYVEPIEPPATPYHLFAQQIMALAMQTQGLVRHDWPAWIGSVPCFAAMGEATERILDFMLATGVLHEDQGKIWFGAEGEKKFGYKNFLELFSVFTTPPLFTVLHGRAELGLVHESTFVAAAQGGQAVLLLGGRSWTVTSLDWGNRRAYVAPAAAGGRSCWIGGSKSMHFEHARAIRRVLATGSLAGLPSQRAKETLDGLRAGMTWVDERGTAVVREASGETQWWTFAGVRTNAMLATAMTDLVATTQVQDNLALPMREHVRAEDIEQRLRGLDVAKILPPVSDEAVEELKFGSCVPHDLALAMLGRRSAEPQALQVVVAEAVRSVSVS
jgi:ATP-dependent Lhr-like helicase